MSNENENGSKAPSVLDLEGQAKVRAGSMSMIVGGTEKLDQLEEEPFDLERELQGCPELPEGVAGDYNSWLG